MLEAGVAQAFGKVSRRGRQCLPRDGCSYHEKMPCNRPVLKQQAGSPRAAFQGCRLPGLFSPDGDSRYAKSARGTGADAKRGELSLNGHVYILRDKHTLVLKRHSHEPLAAGGSVSGCYVFAAVLIQRSDPGERMMR